MAKKIIKPIAKKAPIKKEVAKKETTKRGVKAGVKRGSYKKNKEIETNHETFLNGVNETIEKNEVENIEVEKTENEISEVENIEVEKIENEILENNEQFESFVNENKTDEEFKEVEISEIQNTNSLQINSSQQLDKGKFAHLVNGYMLLTLVDFIFPFFILKVLKVVNKSEKAKSIKMSDIKLTPDQKEALKDSADIIAKMVFDKLSPETVFIFGLGLFYFDNVSSQFEKN